MRTGVVVFPGSNCDQDCYHAARLVLGDTVEYVWHDEADLSGLDLVILPGGFAYGDYLRAGAVARFSPVMQAVARHAAAGLPVLGICNGFQVLLEAGLLPGAMLRNRGLKFVCRPVTLRVETSKTPFTWGMEVGRILRIPVAHQEGNYYLDAEGLARLRERGQVVFSYCDALGNLAGPGDPANPNGSVGGIAGVCNEAGNVVGMMPHPERCADPVLGTTDGRALLEAVAAWYSRREESESNSESGRGGVGVRVGPDHGGGLGAGRG